jgi:Ni/Co efflux regulator RcnB
MPMKTMLILAAAASVLSAPAASLAQPYGGPPPHQHEHWDRGNPNWWRGRPEFRDYAGERAGYWYAPGRGYYRPDPRWYAYHWAVGAYVPFELRGYYVADPYFYGLAPAPYGLRYIHLHNHIALIDVHNGRIVRIVPHVY